MYRIVIFTWTLFGLFSFSFFYNSHARESQTAYINAKSGLVLRKKPTRKSNKIITIPYGKMVNVIGSTSEVIVINNVKGVWKKIQYNKYNGWVFGGYLSNKQVNMDHLSIKELLKRIARPIFITCNASGSFASLYMGKNDSRFAASYEAGGCESKIIKEVYKKDVYVVDIKYSCDDECEVVDDCEGHVPVPILKKYRCIIERSVFINMLNSEHPNSQVTCEEIK